MSTEHRNGTTKRAAGTGAILVHKAKNGSETYYGQFRHDGRLVKRKLGLKRAPGTRDGLTRPQAERQLRRLMDDHEARPAVAERLTVEQAGQRLIAHLTAKGRKTSTLMSYDSVLRTHLVPAFPGELHAVQPVHV